MAARTEPPLCPHLQRKPAKKYHRLNKGGGERRGSSGGGLKTDYAVKGGGEGGKIGMRFGIPGFCVAHVSTSVQLIDFHC